MTFPIFKTNDATSVEEGPLLATRILYFYRLILIDCKYKLTNIWQNGDPLTNVLNN